MQLSKRGAGRDSEGIGGEDMSHCEAIASTGKETLCKQLGGKITRLRASKKELEAEVRQLTAERDRYMALVADAVDAKEAAEKMRDFYRTELAKRGCHDTFCEECGNRCSECTTNMMGTKEAK